MEQHDIVALAHALNRLETCWELSDADEYIAILKMMENYIEKHCQHNIVHDLIDISPDQSKTIRYCTKCEKNFPLVE